MNLKKLFTFYNFICKNYLVFAFLEAVLIFIVTHVTRTYFKSFLMFELLDFGLINALEFMVLNLIVLSISHWIINKKLKKNWLCIIWILPLIIQPINLIRVLISG